MEPAVSWLSLVLTFKVYFSKKPIYRFLDFYLALHYIYINVKLWFLVVYVRCEVIKYDRVTKNFTPKIYH